MAAARGQTPGRGAAYLGPDMGIGRMHSGMITVSVSWSERVVLAPRSENAPGPAAPAPVDPV